MAFIRITANPRAFGTPFSPKEVTAIVASWIARPQVVMINPGPRHLEILRRMLIEGQVAGPLATDAHLAALAIEHGAVLATTDRDFSRFPGLRLSYPLTSGSRRAQ